MDNTTIPTARPHPPTPTEPPPEVRLRATIDGQNYRVLQVLAIETGSSVSDLVGEAVRLLVRWYAAQGLPTARAVSHGEPEVSGISTNAGAT
jgi:hypothetical protein